MLAAARHLRKVALALGKFVLEKALTREGQVAGSGRLVDSFLSTFYSCYF
jgi:hypothetical protein